MDEYIKKEYAVDAVLDVYYDTPDIDLSGEKFEVAIFKIPATDVAPVVHGRWDNIPNTYMLVASKYGSYSGNATTCSVCHEVNPNAYKTNYCPNCGAKMDGERKNEANEP